MKLNSRALSKLTVQITSSHVKKKRGLSILETHIQIFTSVHVVFNCFQHKSGFNFQHSSYDGLNKRSKLSYPKQLSYPYVMSY